MPLKNLRFWQEVYIAAVRSGKRSLEASEIANHALNDLMKITTEKL
jgi:hypothetical protein